ncbi:hypothetical protein Ahy_A04g020168 [Arachis hypogaea]|uniref:FAR1 domain-containing protein n=1 Tax=Arachis hypogaea TaxID=3818 RepID=A0A445DH51_ARAHY|nr:hypothetical protein Ahy_A04g020168 [Arachis hypogaea]
MYVVLDKEKESWVVSRLELRHSHPCSAKKAVHYHEYRKVTIHAKCVITDNDKAGIRPNKTYLALANEVVICALFTNMSAVCILCRCKPPWKVYSS